MQLQRLSARRASEEGSEESLVEPTEGATNSALAEEAAAARGETEADPLVLVPQTPTQRYEARLGEWLGPQVYAAVSDLITLDKLAGYARSGLESSLAELGNLIDVRDPHNAAELDQAISALQATLGPEAEAFVKSHGAAFQLRLQGFVDTHPGTIVLIALLAAAAAVAADMDVPELKTTFHITDELDFTLAARLGTLRNIAIERIEAELQYHSGRFRASLSASYEPDGDAMSGALGVDYAISDELSLYGRGRWNLGDENGGRLDPETDRVRAGMRWRPRPGMSVEAYGEYDEERGAGAGIRFGWSF